MFISRRTFFTFIFFLTAAVTFSQSVVKGKVVDSENGDALMRSTVMLMTADSTRMVTGVATAQDGSFNLKNVKDGTYVVKISYIGFHDFLRQITVKKDENKGTLTIGTVMLVPSSIELNQAVVTGQIKEVEMKEDTLIFNADAFKVPEGSVLEDLIKKLPRHFTHLANIECTFQIHQTAHVALDLSWQLQSARDDRPFQSDR